MDLLIRGGRFGNAPAELDDQLLQLPVDVAPLLHAVEGEEMLAAGLGQLAAGFPVRERFLEEIPELDPGKEIRLLVVEAFLRLVGGGSALARPLARVLHRESRGNDQHLAQGVLRFRRENHAADARVDRQPRKLLSDFGQLVGFVYRAQLGEQRVPVLDRLGRRRVDEGKLLDPAQAERFHSQDDVGKRGAQHFRIRERRARLEFLLRVEADADPARDPAAAACALLRRGLGNAFHAQLLDLVAIAVALDAGETGVDDITDSRDGERRLRDVGREHDAPAGVRLEYALLLLGREPREQGQDLALAREEHEDVALALARQFVRRIAYRLVEIVVFVLRLDRVVTDLHRVEPPGNLVDGSAVAVLREPLGIDGRRGDDELEVRPLIFLTLEELLEVAEQEVDVEAALVRLVDDERVVSAELAVPLRLGEQDAVGHDLDVGAWAHFVGEADLVADRASKLGLHLPGDARSGGARCDPARLGMPYESLDPSAQIEADLGQLRGLARASFNAHDDDLMRGDGPRDLLAPRADRQLGRKLGTRHERAALLDLGRGKCHQECGRGALAPAYLRRSRRSA